MSYNYKTCSYCHGNHAILDCPKLVENAKQASETLANWDEAEYQKRRNVAELFNYGYKREWDDNDNIVYTKSDWDVISSGYYFSHYKAEHGWTKEQYDALPETITLEEYGVHSDVRLNNKRRYERILEIHSEVQAKREARATKSCSYCKGKGHTVRTCPERKKDLEMHEKAFKIYAYYTSRAAARFGCWTGSLAWTRGEEHRPFMWSPKRSYSFQLLIDGIGDSTQEDFERAVQEYQDDKYSYAKDNCPADLEDFRDWIYLSDFMSRNRFVSMEHLHTNGYIPWSHYGSVAADWDTIDFKRDTLTACRFLPVKADDLQKRIYNAIISEYRQVQIPKRKGELDEPQYCFQIAAGNRWHGGKLSLKVTHYSHCRQQLFEDKKVRDENSFAVINEYVEKNQHILNKIEELLVEQ